MAKIPRDLVNGKIHLVDFICFLIEIEFAVKFKGMMGVPIVSERNIF